MEIKDDSCLSTEIESDGDSLLKKSSPILLDKNDNTIGVTVAFLPPKDNIEDMTTIMNSVT